MPKKLADEFCKKTESEILQKMLDYMTNFWSSPPDDWKDMKEIAAENNMSNVTVSTYASKISLILNPVK